jgi:hypothetical protein
MFGKKKKQTTISYDALAKLTGISVKEFKQWQKEENERVQEMCKQTQRELKEAADDREFRVRQHKAKVKLERKRQKA